MKKLKFYKNIDLYKKNLLKYNTIKSKTNI